MRALGACVVLCGAVALSHGATVKRMSLDEVIAGSTEIFVGTVTEKKVLQDDGPRHAILTEVAFRKLVVLKGAIPGKTKRCRFAGGRIGDRTLTVPGVPVFALGKRYVLFACAAEEGLCPTVGWWQGRYQVHRDPVTEVDYLHDSADRPVFGFVEGAPVVAPPSKGAKPLLLSVFVDLVKARVSPDTAAETAGNDKPEVPDAEAPEKDAFGKEVTR